jgi:Zn-dependent protease with chaperone function
MAITLRIHVCPSCGHRIEFDPDFHLWCPACSWNIDPDRPARKPGLLQRLAAGRAERLARSLYQNVRADPPGRRGGYLITTVTWLLALVVYLLTVMVAAAAVLLIYPGFGIVPPLRAVGVLLLGGIAVYVQPVVPAWPKRRRSRGPGPSMLSRADAPELFRLADQVAQAVGTSPVDAIQIGPEFNASYFRYRRQPVIRLGMMLWSVLEPQERVALLGHELGHRINGDLRRSAFVGRALRSLARWRLLLEPQPQRRRRSARGINGIGGMVGLAEVLVPLLLIPFAVLVETFGRLLAALAGRQGQRSEYYADELAGRAGGSAAAASMLESLLVANACRFAARQLCRYQPDADLWHEVRKFAASMPAMERQRLSALATRRLDRIDSTHPPTSLRAALLRERPPRRPAVTLDSLRAAAIDAELSGPAARAAAQLRTSVGH